LSFKKEGLQGGQDFRMSFRQELLYGSPDFLAASELARHLPNPVRACALTGRIVRDPTLLRVITAILRLPLVELQARRADVNAWDKAYFNPARSGRLARAVLDLPTVEEHYLRGHPKQALRTNLRHAREIGITSVRVPAYEVWREATSAILRARDDAGPADWEQHKPAFGQRVAYYVARDAEETPLACARIALFGAFGVLFWMISRSDLHPVTSWARYQLHTYLVFDLSRSGNKHLLVGSAFKEAVGIQYFQHLLGYQARNLRVKVIDT
jgi:hypothetical protein